jgi:hypothetical protein
MKLNCIGRVFLQNTKAAVATTCGRAPHKKKIRAPARACGPVAASARLAKKKDPL